MKNYSSVAFRAKYIKLAWQLTC